MRKEKEAKPWRFTERRKQSIRKARKRHEYLVDLGERAFKRGMR